MATSGLTRTCTIGSILGALDRAGGSVRRVFRHTGISPLLIEEPDRLIFLKDQFALLEATASEIGDPAVAAQLSMTAGIDGLGAYGYMVASQPILRDALDISRQMLPVMLQTATRVGLTVDGRWAHWTYEVDDSATIGRRQNDLLCVGYVLDVFRRFGGPNWVPHRLAIPGGLVRERSAIEGIFGCTLSNGDILSMTFPADLLECSNQAPLLPRPFDWLPQGNDPPALVAHAVSSGLGEDRPNLVRTAHRLGIAPRTLQRRLRGHGTTFERLLDTVLVERAKFMLGKPIALTQIAYDLGFADASHFSRAFKRWTGHAPMAWRKARSKTTSDPTDEPTRPARGVPNFPLKS